MKKKDINKKEDIKEIKNIINSTKIKNIDEFYLIIKYSLLAYIKSIITFGIDHPATNDVINVWNEYLAIKKRENKIFNYILKNSSNIDYDSFNVDGYLEDLDELNDQTDEYYIEVLSDIEDACDMKQAHRAKRMPRKFKTLTEDESFIEELCEGCLNEHDIFKFLKLPKRFIEFMNQDDFHIYHLDHENEENHEFYGINIKEDEVGNIKDIRLMVPIIIDLETALINIHEYQRAYELYLKLDKKLDKAEEERINDSAKDRQESFTHNFNQTKTLLLK